MEYDGICNSDTPFTNHQSLTPLIPEAQRPRPSVDLRKSLQPEGLQSDKCKTKQSKTRNRTNETRQNASNWSQNEERQALGLHSENDEALDGTVSKH